MISGTGAVTMAGSGNMNLTGNNNYDGPTIISTGTLTARNSTALGTTSGGTTVASGAQLNIAPDINIGAEPLTLNGYGIATDGALRKGGGGAGTIFGGPITLATDSGIQLDGNANLNFTNAAGVTGAGTSLAIQAVNAASRGTITGPVQLGSGSLSTFLLGTIVLTATNNAWSGNTAINTGSILQIGDGGANGSIGGTNIQVDGTLTFLSSTNLLITNTISGAGALNQSGSGLLTLAGINSSYSGTATIRGNGTLRLGNTQALGTGTIGIGGAQTDTGRLELLGNLTLNNPITIFPRAFGVLNNPADIDNISGTNTLSPPSPITIGGGGNLLTLQSDGGRLVLTSGITAVGVGRYLVLKGVADGEIQGAISQTTGNSVLVWKLDSGTWTLSGVNSPGAATTISNGVLVVNGSIDNAVTNAGGVLSGIGMITGPVTINSGATLSPGPGIGTLTMSNTLALMPGSTTSIEINKTTFSYDQIVGMTALTYGGTLAVSNLSGTLAAGDSFKIFDAAAYAGTFNSFVLPPLGAGLTWNIGGLTTDGTLRVATVTAPSFTTTILSGTNVILNAIGGAAGTTYSVVTSTNVAAALSTWTVASSGVFSASGTFTSTNAILPGVPRKFFAVRVP
jgi:autotransporter-associated beta strand protein